MLDPLWNIKIPEKSKILNPKDHPLIQKPEELIIKPEKIVAPCVIAEGSDQEFVGNIPVRQDIEVLGADEPKQLRLGWLVFEDIGIGFDNRKRRYKVCG